MRRQNRREETHTHTHTHTRGGVSRKWVKKKTKEDKLEQMSPRRVSAPELKRGFKCGPRHPPPRHGGGGAKTLIRGGLPDGGDVDRNPLGSEALHPI